MNSVCRPKKVRYHNDVFLFVLVERFGVFLFLDHFFPEPAPPVNPKGPQLRATCLKRRADPNCTFADYSLYAAVRRRECGILVSELPCP